MKNNTNSLTKGFNEGRKILMILVDTSVLISFFKGDITEQTKKFAAILELNIPFGINYLIYQELLQEAKAYEKFELLDEYLATQTFNNLKTVSAHTKQLPHYIISAEKRNLPYQAQ